MVALTYAVGRALARFMEALLESRMHSANREIAIYAHVPPKRRYERPPFDGR